MRSTIKRIAVILAALFMVVGITTSCGGKDHAASPVKSTAAPTSAGAKLPSSALSSEERKSSAMSAYLKR